RMIETEKPQMAAPPMKPTCWLSRMNCDLSEPRMSPITAKATAETASAQHEATKSRSRWIPSSDAGGAVEATDAAIGLPLGVRTDGWPGGRHIRVRYAYVTTRWGCGASRARRNASPSRARV